MTTTIDLNLLAALDALLQEGSVTRAATRMRLTVPAMSRTLARLRVVTGDDLLVRAGRTMVPTDRARALRDRVHAAASEARELLGPPASADIASIARTIVVRCNDAVAALLLAPLLRRAGVSAPRLRLRFVPEGDEDVAALREGDVDLDIGVLAFDAPELRTRHLYRERFVGVVRAKHPLTRGRVTLRRFVAHPHLVASRRGRLEGPIDVALAHAGLRRIVAATVPDPLALLHAIADSDFIGSVPGLLARSVTLPITSFPLPVETPEARVGMAWHPRSEADPAHRWLRDTVRELVEQRLAQRRASARSAPRG